MANKTSKNIVQTQEVTPELEAAAKALAEEEYGPVTNPIWWETRDADFREKRIRMARACLLSSPASENKD